jgi:hypothetical protein
MNRATRDSLSNSFFIRMQNTRADETIYWTETSCDRDKEDGKFVRSQFIDKEVKQEERGEGETTDLDLEVEGRVLGDSGEGFATVSEGSTEDPAHARQEEKESVRGVKREGPEKGAERTGW